LKLFSNHKAEHDVEDYT